MPEPVRRRFQLDHAIPLEAVLAPLYRGRGDPTMRLGGGAVGRASWMTTGPSTVVLGVVGPNEIEARGWGAGADEALARVPGLVGLDDDDAGFDPSLHPTVAALARSLGRGRLGRTGSVLEALVPAILEQRITGTEAFRSYRRLVRALGIVAPGDLGLWMPPRAVDLAASPSWTFPGLGIEPRRGALLRRVAADADRLEALAAPAREPGGGGAGASELDARLRAYPGIGPWTSAEVRVRALGDPDAVSLGDAHLPDVVAWVLAGEARGTDERMLELLAPWAGHRARVIRLLERSGRMPPRRGPRVAPRDLVDLAPPRRVGGRPRVGGEGR